MLKRVGADSPVRVNRQKMRVLCSEGINVIVSSWDSRNTLPFPLRIAIASQRG